jgi:hypothetical protein
MLKLYYVFATLSAAGPPSPAEHLREVFYRMGLNDKVLTWRLLCYHSNYFNIT